MSANRTERMSNVIPLFLPPKGRYPSAYTFSLDEWKLLVDMGEAINVAGAPRNSVGDYVLPGWAPDKVYVDLDTGEPIMSIGYHKTTKTTLASTTDKFFYLPFFICLWVR